MLILYHFSIDQRLAEILEKYSDVGFYRTVFRTKTGKLQNKNWNRKKRQAKSIDYFRNNVITYKKRIVGTVYNVCEKND